MQRLRPPTSGAAHSRLSLDPPRPCAQSAARQRLSVDVQRHSFGAGSRRDAALAQERLVASRSSSNGVGSAVEAPAEPLDLNAMAETSGLPRVLIAGEHLWPPPHFLDSHAP